MYLWLSVVNDNPVVRVLQKINTEKIKNTIKLAETLLKIFMMHKASFPISKEPPSTQEFSKDQKYF